MWSRWQRQLPEEKQFSARTIRNAVGHQDDIQTASNRIGYTSTTTTQEYYRSNITKVVPLTLKSPELTEVAV